MKRVMPVAVALLCSLSAFAQPTDAIQNWTAPPFWTQAKVEPDAVVHSGRQALALPSSPMPFVAISPCRILDTRNPSGPYGGPIFAAGEARTYALASANPCTATLPTGIAAFSLNITVTSTAGPGFVEAYPSGVTRPLASNVNFLTAGAQVGNAAVVPTDGTANNDIDIYASQGTHIIVDMNGYYAAVPRVTSLNTLVGDVTLAAGANVSLTPSANTLTIGAVAGGPPSGPAGGSLTGTYPNPGILSGAVGPSQLANSTAVRSINGAAQDLVTLQGSENVSVSTAGSTITIGPPSGSMVLGAPGDTTLIGAGYTEIASTSISYWTATATTNAPSGRRYHTAVWTGSKMIVWGGSNFSISLNDGGQYDPVANAWTATTTTGAPSVRYGHTAVWIGSKMIVWGGYDGGSTNLNDGGQYDPAANTWTATTTTGAPPARYYHTAVWTGSGMIVWGGFGSSGIVNDGGQYDPANDFWTPTTTSGAPSKRYYHTAVWTGSRMIVWGGTNASAFFNDGGQYDPGANTWTATSTTGAPPGRDLHTAVWTGSRMIVWGGLGSTDVLNDGGQYDPGANTWTATATAGAPSGRETHTAVWSGSKMIVWGGTTGSAFPGDGGQYDPAANTWTATATTNAPPGRYEHTAVWTGARMIVWGGFNFSAFPNDGGEWIPVSLYMKN